MRVEAFGEGSGLVANSSRTRGLTPPVALHALAMKAALVAFWRIFSISMSRL
jgi:hypothetical protein